MLDAPSGRAEKEIPLPEDTYKWVRVNRSGLFRAGSRFAGREIDTRALMSFALGASCRIKTLHQHAHDACFFLVATAWNLSSTG